MALTASLTPTEVAVEPGSSATFALDVTGGPDVRLELHGPAAPWAVATGRRVVVHVPRSPRTSPGRSALTVRVVGAGGEVAEAMGTVDVEGFTEVRASLSPRASRGRTSGRHVLRVENCGNRPLAAQVRPTGGDDVHVEVDRASVDLAPGEGAAVPVVVAARRPRLAGRPRTRPFGLAVGDGAVDGLFVQERLRWPVPVAALVLVAGVAAALALGGNGSPSGGTAAAVPTTRAGAVPAQTAACPPRPPEAAGAGALLVQNFLFCPGEVTVPTGTELRWTNADAAAHTASADDDSFDTGGFGRGEQRTVRFDRPGRFSYFCRLHPFMRGTVVVT